MVGAMDKDNQNFTTPTLSNVQGTVGQKVLQPKTLWARPISERF